MAVRKKSISLTNLQATKDLLQLRKNKSLQSFYETNGKLSELSSKISLNQPNRVIDQIIEKNYQFHSIELIVYKKRWFMLIILILNLTMAFSQWLQFCIVSSSIEKFYNIDSETINSTSLIYMFVYCLLFIPIAFYCENHSLKHIAIVGSFGTACGAWLKIFSLKDRNFNYVLIGQATCAVFQIFLSNLPSKLAESWFKQKESLLISGFSIFASQLGMAVNFLLTPLIVNQSENILEIKTELEILLMSTAGFCTIFTIIIVAIFESKPEHAPNHLTALKLEHVIEDKKKNIFQSLKTLLMNKNFVILSVGYGMNIGIFNAFSTLLNSIVIYYFPNSQADVGKIGLSIILVGLIGSVVFAFVLENFKNYKLTAIWNIRLQSIALILFFLALESRSKILLSIASILLGFFMTGFQLIGYEYGVELTFPECDSYVAGILNISGYFFGIMLTLLIQKLQTTFTILFGNLCFALLLMIGIMMVSLTNQDLRRMNANLFIEETIKECELINEKYNGSYTELDQDSNSNDESGIESEFEEILSINRSWKC